MKRTGDHLANLGASHEALEGVRPGQKVALIRPRIGELIEDFARRLTRAADMLGAAQGTHNGIALLARAGETSADLVRRWIVANDARRARRAKQ